MKIKSPMNIRRAERALELWEEWFADDGDPVVNYTVVDYMCFFCRSMSRRNNVNHEHDCIYIRAKELLDE